MNTEQLIILYTSSFPIVVELLVKSISTNNNTEFYTNNIFYSNNICSIILFIIFLYNHISIKNNIYQIALCLIYLQYSFINTFYKHSTYELELIKRVMWFYTTPIMANQYCKINNLNIWKDIKFHYFLGALLITFLPQYKIHKELFGLAFIPLSYFLYSLYKFINLLYTKVFIQIWLLFCCVGIIEYFNLVSYDKTINISFLLDSLAKGIWVLILNENQYNHNLLANDIQSTHLLTSIIKTIDTFINTNEVTEITTNIANNIKTITMSHFSTNNNELNNQVLKSILPYNFDNSYIMNNNSTKKYESIAVLMTDIVSYSELANNHSEEIIYSMLNEMYIRFDKVVKEYKCLQKIETIGDAYMVVGDLTNNYSSVIVIEHLIILGTKFINEIKQIKEFNKLYELKIRIGISLGPVIIGILGNDVPRLSVVGNTVNMSARLQSSTEPDCICLSEEAYKAIEKNSKYKFIVKNNVELKNIGTVTTYTLQYFNTKS